MAKTTMWPKSSSTAPRRAALAVGAAVASTALVWGAAWVLGIELRIDPRNGRPPGVIGLPFAAAVTFVVSVLAWALRAVLDRLTRRGAVVWTALAVIVLLASMLPVLGVGGTVAARTVLALAHLAVAAVLIPAFGLRTAGRTPQRAPGVEVDR